MAFIPVYAGMNPLAKCRRECSILPKNLRGFSRSSPLLFLPPHLPVLKANAPRWDAQSPHLQSPHCAQYDQQTALNNPSSQRLMVFAETLYFALYVSSVRPACDHISSLWFAAL